MIELSFKIDGKMKTFSKSEMVLGDNIRAVMHSIVQNNFYQSETKTPESYQEMQDAYCDMFADFFNGEFSGQQLKKGLTNDKIADLEEIYLLALGGKSEDNDEKK